MQLSSISAQVVGLSSADFSGAAQAAVAIAQDASQMESVAAGESVGQTVDTTA